jgi:hypothetical protein
MRPDEKNYTDYASYARGLRASYTYSSTPLYVGPPTPTNYYYYYLLSSIISTVCILLKYFISTITINSTSMNCTCICIDA